MTIARRVIHWLASAFDAEGLDVTDYFKHIEREFEIVVGIDAIERFKTLADLCAYVSVRLRESGLRPSDDQIWIKVRRITSHEFGVRESALQPDIRYVEDLCC
jgi:hypothetical protein